MQDSLFDSLETVRAPAKLRRKRISMGWEFTDHACRNCMGRVMRRVNLDDTVVVRCAECGSSAVGEPASLCWCGVEVRNHGAAFECFRNPNISLTTPQEVLVRERKVERKPPLVRVAAPVRSRE